MNKKSLILAVIIFSLFASSLAIRIFLIQAEPHIASDGPIYALAGAGLIKGQGFSGIFPPFYPLMIGLSSLLFGDLELSGSLVSAFFGALIIFPLFFIARWAFGRKVAVITCLLTLIYPNLCEFSTKVVAESTFLFLFLLGLIISRVALAKGRPLFYLLAGLNWGAAYLTRPEGFGYFIFLTLIILTGFLKDRKIRRIGYLCLLVAGFLIITTPYLLYLKRDTGCWKWGKQPGFDLVLGENVGSKEDWSVAYEKFYFGLSEDGRKISYELILEDDPGVVAYALSNPRELIRRYIVNLHLVNKYVIPGLFYPLIIVLFSAGLFLGDIGKTKRAAVLFLAFIPYSAVPFFIVAPRYFLPFVPIILIWASRGILETAKWMMSSMKENSPRRQALVEALIVIVVLSSFVPFTFRPLLRGERGPNIYREIGVWIKANLPEDSILMCRKTWLPFYAGKVQAPLPFTSFDKVLQFARDRRANYLIADENEIGRRRDLRFLFDENPAPQDLRLIRKFKDRSGKKIYVFQILKGSP